MQGELDLQGLAPDKLRSFRVDRYYGAEHCVEIGDFGAADVEFLRTIYRHVQDVYATWLQVDQDDEHPEVRSRIQSLRSDAFVAAIRAFGVTVPGKESDLAGVVHDLRGGALTGILGFVQLAEMQSSDERYTSMRRIIILCRDHAKVMRNLVHGLDPVARAADEEEQLHGIDGFVKTWSGVELDIDQRAVWVDVHCTFQGYVTNRCLETSSLDRVLYNLINNAARFTADAKVHLYILAAGERHIRWVVANAIDADQKRWLSDTVGDDLGALFGGGVTRDGHGIGLSNCADIVAASYGVHPDEAVAKGYVGAQLLRHQFCAWFHWPVYVP